MDGGVGALFSAINAAFTFADFVAKLHDVPAEARRFSTLIQRVRTDYNEALRLLQHQAVQAHFFASADEKTYIEGTITSAAEALADIGKFVEKIRVEEQKNTGSVSMGKRLEWMWRYRSKVDSSERMLDTSHKSLLASVQRMDNWIYASSTLNVVIPPPPPVPMGLPTYQEAVKGAEDHPGLLDDFIVARRKKTRTYRREKLANDVSVRVTPVDPSPSEQASGLDEFPMMPARVEGPIEVAYTTAQLRARENAASRTPTDYRPRYAAQAREEAASSRSHLESFPTFDQRPRSLTPMTSMMSMRSEARQFTSSQGHVHRQSLPTRHIPHDSDLYRRQSDSHPNLSSSMYTHDRPRTATEERRDLRRARLSLISSGHESPFG